jgi:hypothetical protein
VSKADPCLAVSLGHGASLLWVPSKSSLLQEKVGKMTCTGLYKHQLVCRSDVIGVLEFGSF